jgi:hypothetical protein
MPVLTSRTYSMFSKVFLSLNILLACTVESALVSSDLRVCPGALSSFVYVHLFYFVLTTHLHLAPMCGAIPTLLQYVLMAWCLIKQWILLYGIVLS